MKADAMAGSHSKVLSHSDVKLSDAPVLIGDSPHAILSRAACTDGENPHEPEISLIHDQHGNVIRIHVRCQCGEDITISCEYPNAA